MCLFLNCNLTGLSSEFTGKNFSFMFRKFFYWFRKTSPAWIFFLLSLYRTVSGKTSQNTFFFRNFKTWITQILILQLPHAATYRRLLVECDNVSTINFRCHCIYITKICRTICSTTRFAPWKWREFLTKCFTPIMTGHRSRGKSSIEVLKLAADRQLLQLPVKKKAFPTGNLTDEAGSSNQCNSQKIH